jgi:single-strand DNA-binding protein
MSLNKCMIIGNLGRDPEMRYTPSGQAVTQFTVATNRNYKDQQGEWQKETEWFRVVVWGQQAERAAENLRKGNKVYVEGRIQTRQWEDQTGQKRYTTELVANQVSSLERRDRGDEEAPFPDEGTGGGARTASTAGPGGASAPRSSEAPPSSGDDFDDLPFGRPNQRNLQPTRNPNEEPDECRLPRVAPSAVMTSTVTAAAARSVPSAPTRRSRSTTRRSTASAATSRSGRRSSRVARPGPAPSISASWRSR